jgi:hypothetical protein
MFDPKSLFFMSTNHECLQLPACCRTRERKGPPNVRIRPEGAYAPPPYINENRSEMAKLGWHVIVVLVEVAQVHLV